ncbi:HtaA domain-containing protein [Actinocorallia longicatena]|uniref:Htaa domain-containing protein n=1 Tax=Actinocorallia longicatena TaxID=111803 RepID=A0ABP6QAD3_9ACTN
MSDGSLVWGVKKSFREYVEHSEGTIAASGQATRDGDAFVFPAAGEALRFTGTVAFEAHGGMLAVKITDPWIVEDEEGLALSVASPHRPDTRLVIARLSAPVVDGGRATAAAALTYEGVSLLGNVYSVKAELDPVVYPA